MGCELDDGTHIPPGSRLAIDMKAIHYDARVYPDPNRCDLFRFSNLRAKDGLDNLKHGFATVDSYVRIIETSLLLHYTLQCLTLVLR